MTITRRALLKAAIATATATSVPDRPGWSQPSAMPAPGAGISFLTIGDWGDPEFRDGARKVAGAMARVSREQETRFVVAAGDNFYPSGVSGVDDPLWRVAYEDIYDDAALNIPWYAILGNHDHRGDVQAQIDYSQHSARWHMPQSYYIVRHDIAGVTADFFCLDTTPMTELTWWKQYMWTGVTVDAQLAWLDAALGSSNAQWKIVVGHHPVFSGGEHGDTAFLVERLMPILERHTVPVYLNGHEHDLQHIRRGVTHYFTSGAAASHRGTTAVEGTQFARAQLGFLAARLMSTTATFAFVDENAVPIYETTLSRPG